MTASVNGPVRARLGGGAVTVATYVPSPRSATGLTPAAGSFVEMATGSPATGRPWESVSFAVATDVEMPSACRLVADSERARDVGVSYSVRGAVPVAVVASMNFAVPLIVCGP